MLRPNADGSWTESVLYPFSGGDEQPIAGLIFDGLGNLYGTTIGGGLHGVGTVFELIAQTNRSWKEKVIHHFTGGADGSAPIDGLAFYADGNIYGTAEEGGGPEPLHWPRMWCGLQAGAGLGRWMEGNRAAPLSRPSGSPSG
jgi:uncharacterized repeat protein (TIGR03803 family)